MISWFFMLLTLAARLPPVLRSPVTSYLPRKLIFNTGLIASSEYFNGIYFHLKNNRRIVFVILQLTIHFEKKRIVGKWELCMGIWTDGKMRGHICDILQFPRHLKIEYTLQPFIFVSCVITETTFIFTLQAVCAFMCQGICRVLSSIL